MKKTLKTLVTLLLCLSMVLSLAACSTKDDAASDGRSFKVGICNYVDDASLNQIVENIESRLKEIESANGVKIEILYDNCQADSNVMGQIIANFISEKVDLMVGIATPVAMAMQSATEENGIPVVFAAVSDPLSTGIVDSLEAPGKNITGTSDFLDTTAVLNLIFANDPAADKVGLLYDIGQDASTSSIAAAKAYLDAKGVAYVERTGTNVDEVKLAAQALVSDGVDAVFTPTDNTIMTAELSIYEAFADAKIPHYAGADSFALNGAFVGYGVDYANLGVETANMIKEILVDGKKPATLAVRTFDNGTATVNTEVCSALGLDLAAVKTAFTPYCLKIVDITTAENFGDIK